MIKTRATHRPLIALVWMLSPVAGSSLTGCSTQNDCLYNGHVYPAGTTIPSPPDSCNSCSCTANGTVVCSLGLCVEPSCVLDTTYTFGGMGGLVAYAERATLAPPGSYRYERIPSAQDPATLSCAPAMPSCGDTTKIDITDINRDLEQADVMAALAQASPPVFGHDSRPVDGQVYGITRADGHGLAVGSPCGASEPQCTPIPAAVQQLVDDLQALNRQQLMDPSCAGFAPLR